jgi:hypothetical protein
MSKNRLNSKRKHESEWTQTRALALLPVHEIRSRVSLRLEHYLVGSVTIRSRRMLSGKTVGRLKAQMEALCSRNRVCPSTPHY